MIFVFFYANKRAKVLKNNDIHTVKCVNLTYNVNNNTQLRQILIGGHGKIAVGGP